MYLLRHGQSEFNVHFSKTRVDPGIEDPALTPLGRSQAVEAAEHLAGLPIRRIVASPYRRALQTAMAVAERLMIEIEIDPLIRERCWFVCDVGTPAAQLRQDWPHIDFGDLPDRWWPEAGESEDELDARCRAFADRLDSATGWGETVYVSHWGFIRGLTGHTVANGTLVALAPQAEATVVHVPTAC